MDQGTKRRKSRKKKNNSLIPILCLIIGILLGVIVSMLILGNDGAGLDLKRKQQSSSKNTVEEMLKEEAFKIETAHCDLYYPLKWKDQVRVEIVDAAPYTAKFYATVEGKEEVQIFDIVFADEEGIALGYLKGEKGEQIPVNFISYEMELGADWTEKEQDVVYAMVEDVNYILGMLQKETGFKPAN